jgi:SH3 domain-containing YSC84-like protein 1
MKRFGGQIGAEVTDFVIILNTEAAVKAFSMGGNVTLGGNLSVSAGPFGR